MAIVLGSLQSTLAIMLVDTVDIQSIPTNNKVVADVLARPAQASATGYKGLCLIYIILYLTKMNYINWAAKTENLLEIQSI